MYDISLYQFSKVKAGEMLLILNRLTLVIFDFGSQVVTNVAQLFNAVFNYQGNIWRHRQLHLARQGCCLCELIQVPTSESESNWFLHLNGDRLLFLVDAVCLRQFYVCRANISGCRELDAFLCTANNNRLAELRQISAYSGELHGWHLHHTTVFGLWDSQVFLVEVHQFHLVVRHFLLVLRFEHKGHRVSVVLGFHGDCVIVVGAFQDLRHTGQIHSHGKIAVTTEFVESI